MSAVGPRGGGSAGPEPGAAAELDRSLAAELGRLFPAGVAPAGLVVLGSGLGAFAERLEGSRAVAFADLAGCAPSGVPGHAGRFVAGHLGGVPLLVQAGRLHRYEGHPSDALARGARAAARLGARWCLLTNAAGALDPGAPPGTLLAVVDHLDLQARPALRPGEGGRGSPYGGRGVEALERAAHRAGVELRRGVYAGCLGPAYETPAEIRLLRRLGADAVGMSTVAEAQVAAACGLGVAALSCLTNAAAGVGPEPLSHAAVVAAGTRAAPRFAALVEAAVRELEGVF